MASIAFIPALKNRFKAMNREETNTMAEYILSSPSFKVFFTCPLIALKYRAKLAPERNINIIQIHSMAGELNEAMERFVGVKPAAPIVPKVTVTALYKLRPNTINSTVSNTERKKYMDHRAIAVCLI